MVTILWVSWPFFVHGISWNWESPLVNTLWESWSLWRRYRNLCENHGLFIKVFASSLLFRYLIIVHYSCALEIITSFKILNARSESFCSHERGVLVISGSRSQKNLSGLFHLFLLPFGTLNFDPPELIWAIEISDPHSQMSARFCARVNLAGTRSLNFSTRNPISVPKKASPSSMPEHSDQSNNEVDGFSVRYPPILQRKHTQ